MYIFFHSSLISLFYCCCCYIFGIISKTPLPNPKSWKFTISQLHSFVGVTNSFVVFLQSYEWSLHPRQKPMYQRRTGLLLDFQVYFIILYTILMPGSHYFGYCKSIVVLKLGSVLPPTLFLLFSWFQQNYSGSLAMPYEFWDQFIHFFKKGS